MGSLPEFITYSKICLSCGHKVQNKNYDKLLQVNKCLNCKSTNLQQPVLDILEVNNILIQNTEVSSTMIIDKRPHTSDTKKIKPQVHAKCKIENVEVTDEQTVEQNAVESKAPEIVPPIKHESINEPPEVVKPPQIDATSKPLINITDIIQGGSKGVTNKQMIPVIKSLIDSYGIDDYAIVKIKLLIQHYRDVFNASMRYVGKDYGIRFGNIAERENLNC